MPDRIPLYYTFGNHMHWVDMEWLWGYHVLPGCVRDMLALCREAGVKGCVNFDGIGYEKLASEDPEAFSELRTAIREGLVEVVGGSYGQPYGLFHGGESNIRQRIFGARTCRRLFGVPVKTFWEEEFDFFPQLPQILRGVGIEYSSLFFQWTWHTPEVPREVVPVVCWEGQDGSRLLCATRNKLNLHQWPEDMDIVLGELAGGRWALGVGRSEQAPLILQWLELMPSPDWMCRAELILPKLRELMGDPRFDVKPVTLGEYLRALSNRDRDGHATIPIRKYSMDQVWHGMTLGKNGDYMRQLSRKTEDLLLGAESIAATAGLFGRPYAQWDVYPTWELEEAWRELLSAQHHDNDECEGLCGYVGKFSYERSESLSRHIRDRHISRMAEDLAAPGDAEVLYNPLGWERTWHVVHRKGFLHVATVPAFGWTAVYQDAVDAECGEWAVDGRIATFERGPVKVVFDLDNATVIHFANSAYPEGISLDGKPLWEWCGSDKAGQPLKLRGREVSFDGERPQPQLVGSRLLRLAVDFEGYPDHGLTVGLAIEPHTESLEVSLEGTVPNLAPGLNPAFGWRIPTRPHRRIVADTPLGIQEISPDGEFLKKYPTGDWMTSPQWFETVRAPFSGSSFVDLTDAEGSGFQIAFCGAKQWFAEQDAVRTVLTAYDPWDEGEADFWFQLEYRFTPHQPMAASSLWKLAQEFVVPCEEEYKEKEGSRIPATFSPANCDAKNVALTAFYRETRDCAKGQPSHAADELGVDYPYVLRMVELDGVETDALLTFGAIVAGAVRTNLLGEADPHPLAPSPISRDGMLLVGQGLSREETGEGGALRIHLRPFEIATIYLDLVEGRKQVRDLDAKREIWATVHRVEQ